MAPSTAHRILDRAKIGAVYLHDGNNGKGRWVRQEIDDYVASARAHT